METQDNFDIAAQKGNDIFNNFCAQQRWCKVKRFTTEKFADYDVVYTTNNNLTIGEIKRRNQKITDFDGWFLEKDKYERLMEIKKSSTKYVKVTYINHFKNNVTLIWDLDSIDVTKLDLTQCLLPENDYSDRKVMKWVFKLPVHLAERKEITDEKLGLFEIQY